LGIANHELQFRQWLGEHTGLLVKVVRSFAEGPADQDDLFQEILLQVWLSLPNFREDSKPTTWLYRVALNTALAWKRGEKKRSETKPKDRPGSLSIADVAAPSDSSAEAERNDRIVEQLYTAIRALPPAKRALVVLYLDGFTYREIADVVGISESNVGVSLNRIKKDLAAAVKEGGDEISG
jgi:RNA polymerase sigma-70 factor, ECF subfamily